MFVYGGVFRGKTQQNFTNVGTMDAKMALKHFSAYNELFQVSRTHIMTKLEAFDIREICGFSDVGIMEF